MNDCFWCCTCVCECDSCICDKYISMNSEQGNKLEEEYRKDVDKALEPVREMWAKRRCL